jgi:hypothetical protein
METQSLTKAMMGVAAEHDMALRSILPEIRPVFGRLVERSADQGDFTDQPWNLHLLLPV